MEILEAFKYIKVQQLDKLHNSSNLNDVLKFQKKIGAISAMRQMLLALLWFAQLGRWNWPK